MKSEAAVATVLVAMPGSVLASLVRGIKNAQNQGDPMTPLIDEYLLKRDKSPNRYEGHYVALGGHSRKPGRISPSGIGGCQRKAEFQFLGMPAASKRVDPDQELMFESGNWLHAKWQALAYDMEAVLGSDRFHVIGIELVCAIPELYIDGHLDLYVKIDGKRWIIDIKTTNEWAFTQIQHSGPKPDHIKQVATYCRARNCPRGMVLYDDRSYGHFKIFVIDVVGVAWDEVEEWVMGVLRYMTKQRVAPKHPDCTNGSNMARDCPYKRYCHSGMRRSQVREIAFENFVDLDAGWDASHAPQA